MDHLSFDVFCSKLVNCEAQISVITEILAENDAIKYKIITREFEKLKIFKVKHLARATLGVVSSIQLSGDALSLLYDAVEIYSKSIDNLLQIALSEYQKKNYATTLRLCLEVLHNKPTNKLAIYLISNSLFKTEEYEKCIKCLETAISFNFRAFEILNNLAFLCWKTSKNDEAKQYLFETCELKPFCADTWTNYADLLFYTNDLYSAELVYERVLSLNPKLYKVRNAFGKLLLKLNKIKYAKKQFKIALESATECPETLSYLGDLNYMNCKFEKAISNYEKALEINSDLKDTHISLGMAYLKVKELPKAVDEFLKALDLESENVFVLRNLAVTYCYQENMIMSVEVFKKCLKLQPENFDFNLDLALIYLHNLKNYQEAIIYFKKCIQLNPERKDLYKNLFTAYWKSNDHLNASVTCMSLGELYLENDDQENARNAFTCAILWNPENAYGHWKVGLTMYNLGHFELALIRYKKAIELKPNLVNVYCDIAIIYEEKGLSERAMEYYKMAIQLEPDHLNTLYNLTYLKQKLDQIDDEIVDIYQRILQIDESEAFDLHTNLADIFKTKGNFTDALMHYEKALEYDNTCVKIYMHMGNIYSDLNKSEDAICCFNKAIEHDHSA